MKIFYNKFVRLIISIIFSLNLLCLPIFSKEKIKTIAIAVFSNNTGSKAFDNLQEGLADALTNNLARYKSFVILERGKLNEAIRELTLSQSGFVTAESAVNIGKLIGSEYIIFSSVLKAGELYQVSLRIVNIETGKVILGESIEYSNEESIINSKNYFSLKTAASLGESIDSTQLKHAMKNIEKIETKNTSSCWLYISRVVVILGIIAGRLRHLSIS